MARLHDIDLEGHGLQLGSLEVSHSDNRHDHGVIPVPVAVLTGTPGPTVLLLAGTHGDEYEGQVLLHRLIREVSSEEVNGRLIILPALNLPAVRGAGRVSPLDGGNLNRAYPGAERGGPTDQVAHFVSTELVPRADYAVDLHSGGTNSFYLPSAFVYEGPDPEAFGRKRQAAEAFGMPWSFLVPERFEPSSFSTACDDAGVCMISTELGGGGQVDAALVEDASWGLRRLLACWGLLAHPPAAPELEPTRWVGLDDRSAVRTPAPGLFEPLVQLADPVREGQLVGRVHPVENLRAPSVPVTAHRDGIVAVIRRPPLVTYGDFLLTLVNDMPL